MIKAVIVFLIVMLGIGMIGNALFPGRMTRKLKKTMANANPLKKPPTCKRCGRYVIGKSGCDCGKG